MTLEKQEYSIIRESDILGDLNPMVVENENYWGNYFYHSDKNV